MPMRKQWHDRAKNTDSIHSLPLGMTSIGQATLVPVCCPKCGESSQMKCPVVVLDMALNNWNRMNLHTDCCDVYWDATPADMQVIREHFQLVRAPD